MNTIKLTSTDLMNLHGETLAEMQQERLMRNIAARAAVLFTSAGYSQIRTMDTENVTVFQVRSPEGKRYQVKVSATPAAPGTFFGSKCSYPCFEEHSTCKHLQACALLVKEEAAEIALCEAHDAQTADAAWFTDRQVFQSHRIAA